MKEEINKKELIDIGHTWDSYDDGLLCITCRYQKGVRQEIRLNSILKCWGNEYHILYSDEYNDEQGHDTAYYTNFPYSLFESLCVKIKNMYSEIEFKARVARKIEGWYNEESYKTKAIDRIVNQRNEIVALLRSTGRDGVENVIEYLDMSGFFYRASSSNKHHNWPGGLAEHSLGTYKEAAAKPEASVLPADSVIIASLLHDTCKADRFWFKGRRIIEHEQHGIDSKHSLRSVLLVKNCGMELKEEERLAIRWHMKGERYHSRDRRADADHTKAVGTPLWRVVFYADKQDAAKHPAGNQRRNK